MDRPLPPGGTDKDGKKFTVLMNLNTKEGKARKTASPLEGEELKKLLESAYGAWVNDTYWLLMPYKMMDPGVVLAYDGEPRRATPPGTRCASPSTAWA